jgi:hypothetical protein
MTKYLISVATELEGHAGASAYYIQTEDRVTRAEKLKVINALFDKGSVFEEYGYRAKSESDMVFYGEVKSSFVYDGETIPHTESISVSWIKLPSRMDKNKLYGTETRTG